MKITLNLTWAIFWIALAYFLIHIPEPSWMTSERECAKNGGVIIRNTWGNAEECKIYKK